MTANPIANQQGVVCMPGQDPTIQAGICLYDFLLNPAVRGELIRTLAEAKADKGKGEAIIGQFLSRRKYETTPAILKQVFTEHRKNPLTASPEAMRFAVAFAVSPVLRLDWYDASRKTAAALRASSADSEPTAPLTAVLQKNGFSKIDPLRAGLGIVRLMSQGLGGWAGVYSQTTLANRQGQSENGPILTIDATQNPIQVKLDSTFIFNFSFDTNTNTLSWTKGGSGAFTNTTAANLAFSSDGSTASFQGTLDLPKRDKYTLFGELDYQGSADHPKSNGGGGDGGGFSAGDIIGIVFGVVGFVSAVLTGIGAYYAWKSYRAGRNAQEPPKQMKERGEALEQRMEASVEKGGVPRSSMESIELGELGPRMSAQALEMAEIQSELGNLPASERAEAERELEERSVSTSDSDTENSGEEYETADEGLDEVVDLPT